MENLLIKYNNFTIKNCSRNFSSNIKLNVTFYIVAEKKLLKNYFLSYFVPLRKYAEILGTGDNTHCAEKQTLLSMIDTCLFYTTTITSKIQSERCRLNVQFFRMYFSSIKVI